MRARVMKIQNHRKTKLLAERLTLFDGQLVLRQGAGIHVSQPGPESLIEFVSRPTCGANLGMHPVEFAL